MCNAYRIGRDTRTTPAVLPEGLLRELSEDRLVRRTDRAPVNAGGSDLVTMRWGFERPGLGTVQLARGQARRPDVTEGIPGTALLRAGNGLLRVQRTDGPEAHTLLHPSRWRLDVARRDLDDLIAGER